MADTTNFAKFAPFLSGAPPPKENHGSANVCRHVFATPKYMFSKFSAVHSLVYNLILNKNVGLKFATFYEYFKNNPLAEILKRI